MRSLPTLLTQELAKEFNSLGHLIEFSLDSTYRFTDKDMDVVYGGNTYLSRGIEFDAAQYSLLPKVDNLSFEIDNVALEMSAIVMGSETRGKQCIVYRAAFDSHLQIIGVSPLFIGYLDQVEVDHQRASFGVVNQFIKWNTPTPRRKHEVACRWTFKDPDTCKYAGGLTTCDHSYDACVTRANAPNFPGFRWLVSLQDKKIQWGRTS